MVAFSFDPKIPQDVRADDVFNRLAEALTKGTWGQRINTVEVTTGGPWSVPHRNLIYPYCYLLAFKDASGQIVDPAEWPLCVTPSGQNGELVFHSSNPAFFPNCSESLKAA